jgi:putative membrane protein
VKPPIARTIENIDSTASVRAPRAYAPESVAVTEPVFDPELAASDLAAPPRRTSWPVRIVWVAAGILVSAGLSLMADRLVRDLFAANPWLGWAGIAVIVVLVAALVVLVAREAFALRRLRVLDELRQSAAQATRENDQQSAKRVIDDLLHIYTSRPDLARPRQAIIENAPHLFDGHELVSLAERSLMSPLDARAKVLTAATARRVALVTAVSPRALVDVAFVIYESVRLAGAIAALYGARPGFFGFWRLTGAVLAHLAVTGGMVLTDGIVEQLVGQGIAARISARLGEGVVNGLMTVRVGIAAMRVVRPLPFDTQTQPLVRDFIPELTKLVGDTAKQP